VRSLVLQELRSRRERHEEDEERCGIGSEERLVQPRSSTGEDPSDEEQDRDDHYKTKNEFD